MAGSLERQTFFLVYNTDFIQVKIDIDKAIESEEERKKKYELWTKIYLHWYSRRNSPNAVNETMLHFGTYRNEVLKAISWGLKGIKTH